MGNNEHKHRDYTIRKKKKKKLHKEKIKTTTRGNDMKKVQVQKQEERLTTIKRKTPEQRSLNQKYLTCQAKRCPGIKLIFFFVA